MSGEQSSPMPLKLGREATISYDQLILLQLSRCSRPMGTETFVRCVLNFLTLLPPDVRLEVQKREGAILRALEKEKETFCGSPSNYKHGYEYGECVRAKSGEIALKVAEELNIKSYYYIIYYLLIARSDAYAYCQSLLEMSLAVDVLHEKGLIGFKEKPLYVGAVDVPRKSDKVVHK